MSWEPTPDDYWAVLNDQNPWWSLGRVPESYAKPISRVIGESLYQQVQSGIPQRYQLLLGPRQVGKTVLMHQTIQKLLECGIPSRNLLFLRVDHPFFMPLPLGLLIKRLLKEASVSADSPLYVFLDEVTYAADWDRWLKTFYDEKWPVQIVATSSATIALRDKGTESGVGRWEEQYLTPWTFEEYLALQKRSVGFQAQGALAQTIESIVSQSLDWVELEKARRRYLLHGGFPGLLEAIPEASRDDETAGVLRSQQLLRSEAIERVIYKDIPQVYGIEEPVKLERLLYVLAGQIGGIMKPTTLGNDIGLSKETVSKYLGYLERSFLVFTLPSFAKSEEAIQRRGRKLYFYDGAVRNAALQRGIAPMSDNTEMGHLVENVIASHLNTWCHQSASRLYHWRESNREVDLVVDDPNDPCAFEVGLSSRHSISNLQAFAERHPRFQGRCFYVSPGVVPILPDAAADGIGRVPLDMALLAISAQISQAVRQRFAK